jgi:hypothetical protein
MTMATRKTAAQKAAEAQEPQAQEPQVQVEPKAEPKPAAGLAKFQMERGAYLVQPSTGIRISLKEVRELKDDSWAELQVGAGLLKRV